MSHLEEDELIQYAEDPDSLENVGTVEDHLRTCAECWQAVHFYRRLCDSFRAEETWDLHAGADDSKERSEAALFESRRAEEDASAEGLLEPYLRSAYEFGYADRSRSRGFARAVWSGGSAGPLTIKSSTTRNSPCCSLIRQH